MNQSPQTGAVLPFCVQDLMSCSTSQYYAITKTTTTGTLRDYLSPRLEF